MGTLMESMSNEQARRAFDVAIAKALEDCYMERVAIRKALDEARAAAEEGYTATLEVFREALNKALAALNDAIAGEEEGT